MIPDLPPRYVSPHEPRRSFPKRGGLLDRFLAWLLIRWKTR